VRGYRTSRAPATEVSSDCSSWEVPDFRENLAVPIIYLRVLLRRGNLYKDLWSKGNHVFVKHLTSPSDVLIFVCDPTPLIAIAFGSTPILSNSR